MYAVQFVTTGHRLYAIGNISFIENYQDLTMDNIKVAMMGAQRMALSSNTNITLTYEYDSETGDITITADTSYFAYSDPSGFVCPVFINPDFITLTPTSYGRSEVILDMTSIDGYTLKGVDNFYPIFYNIYGNTNTTCFYYEKVYDSETGTLTLNASAQLFYNADYTLDIVII